MFFGCIGCVCVLDFGPGLLMPLSACQNAACSCSLSSVQKSSGVSFVVRSLVPGFGLMEVFFLVWFFGSSSVFGWLVVFRVVDLSIVG